jgi:hypothetical protein
VVNMDILASIQRMEAPGVASQYRTISGRLPSTTTSIVHSNKCDDFGSDGGIIPSSSFSPQSILS